MSSKFFLYLSKLEIKKAEFKKKSLADSQFEQEDFLDGSLRSMTNRNQDQGKQNDAHGEA